MLGWEGTPMWDWEEAKQRFPVGRLVTGTVTSHHPFGVFIDLKDPGATGLVPIPEFLDGGRMTEDQYPPVSTSVTAGVLGHTDPNRRQVWLTMRPNHLRSLGPAMTEPEWQACTNPVPMLESLRGTASERKLRLFACGCEREYLRFRADLGDNGILSRLIAVTERYVDGAATFEEWDAVRCCVHGMFHATDPHFHASHASEGAESAAGWYRHPADGNPNHPQRLEQFGYQSDLLRDIFGNPFRPLAFSPEWLTSTVVALAEHMYESRDFSAMPILADAFQDAGCNNDDILNHCGDAQQVHVRGCWVVDLLLGKE